MHRIIRNTHLLLASFSLPFLLMYSLSAVQMTHQAWFDLKPSVRKAHVALTPGQTDAREITRELSARDASVRGELTNVQANAAGVELRIVLPGTVHDVQYDRVSGAVTLKTSVAGFMGMLNRLHHAAGLTREVDSLKIWGAAVAIVSLALLVLGATGIYMWFTRRPERSIGLVLLGVNLVFALVVLRMIRSAGP